MRVKRSVFALISAVVWLLAANLAVGSNQAQAAAPSNHQAGTYFIKLPPAPRGAHSAAALAPDATSPWIDPSVDTTENDPGDIVPCHSGVLCPAVWDPTTAKWKVFNLSRCALYKVFYWNDWGTYVDNQTGGVESRYYDRGYNIVNRFWPTGGAIFDQRWDDVYYIRNCF
jgi:hypothetical protein